MPTRANRTMDLVEILRTIPRSSLPIGVAWAKCEEAADEIERLRRIIYNLLDDGDEADRAEARAALGEGK